MNKIAYPLLEFDADFEVLLNLPVKSQEIIFKKINPDIDCLFIQMDSLSEATFTSVVSALAQRAKESRNQALRQGALDKTDNNWMSAALLEHTYNSILSGDKSAAQHISKKLMGWMNGMEMICMDLEIQNRSTITGSERKDYIIDCPSCKTKYKVPTNRHIEVACKNCKYKWKIHT